MPMGSACQPRGMHAARAALMAAVCSALVVAAMAQGGPPKEKPQLADIPYIRCQVCKLLVKNAWRQVQALKAAATPSKKLEETAVIECMEKITTAWRPEGEWIARLDLVEEGNRLAVREMGQVGKCGVECKTIEKAAERIMGEHDTDIAEVLFTGQMDYARFNTWLCHELSDACKVEPPPLPKGRQPGPPFEPMQDGDQNLERIMGEMADNGMKGSMYSRDDLLAKYGMQEGDDDDEDAEEDVVDGAANFEGAPTGTHHTQGGKSHTTPTPVQRALDQARGAAQEAAAAASSGFKVAAGMARGMWDKVRGVGQVPQKPDEL